MDAFESVLKKEIEEKLSQVESLLEKIREDLKNLEKYKECKKEFDKTPDYPVPVYPVPVYPDPWWYKRYLITFDTTTDVDIQTK